MTRGSGASGSRPVIRTERLTLLAATADLIRLEINDLPGLSTAIGAAVPDGWPPVPVRDVLPLFAERLTERPGEAGWHAWYWLYHAESGPAPILVGSGGFKGPPDAAGTAEVGYGLLPPFKGRGYAAEAVQALALWAFASGATRLIAEAASDNLPSIRLLDRLRFTRAGDGAEPGTIRFVLDRRVGDPPGGEP